MTMFFRYETLNALHIVVMRNQDAVMFHSRSGNDWVFRFLAS